MSPTATFRLLEHPGSVVAACGVDGVYPGWWWTRVVMPGVYRYGYAMADQDDYGLGLGSWPRLKINLAPESQSGLGSINLGLGPSGPSILASDPRILES